MTSLQEFTTKIRRKISIRIMRMRYGANYAKSFKEILNSGERYDPTIISQMGYHEPPAHEIRYRFANRFIGSGDTILDIACGTGYGTKMLSRAGNQTTGVDISVPAIQYAQKHYSGPNIKYVLSDFFATDIAVDAIVCFETIEHLQVETPKVVLDKLFGLSPKKIIGSIPYKETSGSNPNHILFNLDESIFESYRQTGRIDFYYQMPNGIIRDNKPPEHKIQNIIFVWQRMNDPSGSNPKRIHWLPANQLISAAEDEMLPADVLLDIGCGIYPQQHITPLVHICLEPFQQYVTALQEKNQKQFNTPYLILQGTWADALKIFPPKSVDTVYLGGVIEHLDKEEGVKLLKQTESIVRRQIIISTPLGFLKQEHPDGKDIWGLDGGKWQTHRSGWTPNDFDDSWNIFAAKDFYLTDNAGRPLNQPHGSMWAIKTFSDPQPKVSVARFRSSLRHLISVATQVKFTYANYLSTLILAIFVIPRLAIRYTVNIILKMWRAIKKK